MVALELTGAFDTVDHLHLLNDTASSNLSNNTKDGFLPIFVVVFLHTYVEIRVIECKHSIVKQVVHQDGVFSPVVLNVCCLIATT